MAELEHVLAVQNELGEGPRWHPVEQALYWVDIIPGRVYRWRPGTDKPEVFEIGGSVGALAFRQSGGLVLATGDGFAFWDGPDQPLRPIANPEPDKSDGRLNDGVVDRNGRFWAGTLAPNFTSALYRLDPDGSIHTMLTEVGTSNGIGWSPDNTIMYYINSDRKAIAAFDYDAASGTISNRREFVKTADNGGVPDGLVMDSAGYVWAAHWGGWNVTRYAPDGSVDRVIQLPAGQVTACTFGGANLDELYITTAWYGLDDEQRKAQPQAGDLFRLKLGIRGLAEPQFAG